jgi:hypothetical protein
MKTILITLVSVIILFFYPDSTFGHVYDVVNSATGAKTSKFLPIIGLTKGYAFFSTNGSVTNSGNTFITGDIGTTSGQATGFNELNVTGIIHPLHDHATNMCKDDLRALYNTLNLMVPNTEIPNPAHFGHGLILSPQIYHINAATILTDTLYIDALGDSNAVFVIQINGVLTSASNSRVVLLNGAQSKNVFWKIEGSITLNDNSVFRGIIVANNGAIVLKSDVILDGAAFTTNGAITVASSTVKSPYSIVTTNLENIGCQNPDIELIIAPNPFGSFTTINLKDDSKYENCTFSIYNMVGVEVMSSSVSKQVITLDTSRLPAGVYFYKLSDKTKIIQSGKLISEN